MTVVLYAGAIALLAWAATAFIDSDSPAVHLLAAISPLVTVLSLPVIAVGIGRGSVVPTALAGLAAVTPWVVAAGYAAAGPGPTSTTGNNTIRVMYLDAAGGRAGAASITAVVRGQGADVVVMTGLSDALSHELAVAGLNRMVTPRWVSIPTGSSHGIGVWSQQGTADLHLVPGTSLPTAQGPLTTPAGTVDLVIAQQPGSFVRPGPGWRADLTRTAGLPAGSPHRILVGDLGATPWNPSFRALTRQGWHDAADVLGRGLRPTWPSWSPLPITPSDHLLVSAGMGVSSADTARVDGTSHRATFVTVIVPS